MSVNSICTRASAEPIRRPPGKSTDNICARAAKRV
jgi:hypothetical protein